MGFAVGAAAVLVLSLFKSNNQKRQIASALLLGLGVYLSIIVCKWSRSQDFYFGIHQELYDEAAQAVLRGAFERDGVNITLPVRYEKLSVGIVRSYRRGNASDILFCYAGFAGELEGCEIDPEGSY